MARFVGVFLVCFLISPVARAQMVRASDTQALQSASQAVNALSGGVPVSDVTLNANVTSIAGSDYLTGTGIFRAKGTMASRVDLDLKGTIRSEIRNGSNGIPTGAWTSETSALHPEAQHNCWTDAVWFFPLLSSLTQGSNPNIVLSYVGSEQHAGVSALHLRISQSSGNGVVAVSRLSAMDFYIDPVSSLPLALAFKAHPDADMNTDIAIEIRYANYQAVNGVQIPFHIQRLINGGVALDVVVNNATINSGISDTPFSIE